MMVGLERPQGQPRIFTHPANTNEPSMYDPEITVEGEDAVQTDMGGDKCCEEARMKFREVLRKHFGRASWGDIDIIVGGSCEELQQELEDWISQRWVEEKDKDKDGITLHEDLLRIQNEWDACSSESFGGMFTASADALEEGWGAIQKNRPINPFNAGAQRLVENYQPNEFLAEYAGEMPVEADMGGDACCIDAKNKWIEGLREIFGEDGRHGGDLEYSLPGIQNMHTHPYLSANAEIYRHYEEMSCEEFRDAIEQFAGGRPGKLYDANVKRGRGLPPTSEHYLAKRILEEWDRCEAQSTFGDNLDIYASSDAFEAGWNAILKSRGQYHG